MEPMVPFEPEAVKELLDRQLRMWRRQEEIGIEYAKYYVEAYQSVRVWLFGEVLEFENGR